MRSLSFDHDPNEATDVTGVFRSPDDVRAADEKRRDKYCVDDIGGEVVGADGAELSEAARLVPSEEPANREASGRACWGCRCWR